MIKHDCIVTAPSEVTNHIKNKQAFTMNSNNDDSVDNTYVVILALNEPTNSGYYITQVIFQYTYSVTLPSNYIILHVHKSTAMDNVQSLIKHYSKQLTNINKG